MSKPEVDESPDNGTERAEDRVNQKHQKALGRFGKYSAPALLALLVSGKSVSASV
jgi:hypothetical protein